MYPGFFGPQISDLGSDLAEIGVKFRGFALISTSTVPPVVVSLAEWKVLPIKPDPQVVQIAIISANAPL